MNHKEKFGTGFEQSRLDVRIIHPYQSEGLDTFWLKALKQNGMSVLLVIELETVPEEFVITT